MGDKLETLKRLYAKYDEVVKRCHICDMQEELVCLENIGISYHSRMMYKEYCYRLYNAYRRIFMIIVVKMIRNHIMNGKFEDTSWIYDYELTSYTSDGDYDGNWDYLCGYVLEKMFHYLTSIYQYKISERIMTFDGYYEELYYFGHANFLERHAIISEQCKENIPAFEQKVFGNDYRRLTELVGQDSDADSLSYGYISHDNMSEIVRYLFKEKMINVLQSPILNNICDNSFDNWKDRSCFGYGVINGVTLLADKGEVEKNGFGLLNMGLFFAIPYIHMKYDI